MFNFSEDNTINYISNNNYWIILIFSKIFNLVVKCLLSFIDCFYLGYEVAFISFIHIYWCQPVDDGFLIRFLSLELGQRSLYKNNKIQIISIFVFIFLCKAL